MKEDICGGLKSIRHKEGLLFLSDVSHSEITPFQDVIIPSRIVRNKENQEVHWVTPSKIISEGKYLIL